MSSTKTITVVSFNENEANAVEMLLDELLARADSPWRKGRGRLRPVIRDGGADLRWSIQHVALRAQGNVIAAAQLAAEFARVDSPDFVVFYGCAGAIHPSHQASVVLVKSVNYLSLGTVEDHAGAERVTLKNKWLCHLRPPGDVEPLGQALFPIAGGGAPVDLCALSGLPTAHVAATDKVIRVRPGVAPDRLANPPPHSLYASAEWTYGTALGLVLQDNIGTPVLVEMESYGIGAIAAALRFEERVVVLRVTTDALTNHSGPDGHARQRDLLEQGRAALALVLLRLLDPTGKGGAL